LIIPGINDLATLNKELAEQYSPLNPIPVNRIPPKTKLKVLWNYPCGHSYEASVKDRFYGKGCKFCNAGLAHLKCNLLTVCPEVAIDWDYTKNEIGPDKVRPKSNTPRYWICSNCRRPAYQTPCSR